MTVNSSTTARDGFDLDVRIVTAGMPAAAMLGDTDDGCDTQRDGDC
jgi:FxLD family lantipeptide